MSNEVQVPGSLRPKASSVGLESGAFRPGMVEGCERPLQLLLTPRPGVLVGLQGAGPLSREADPPPGVLGPICNTSGFVTTSLSDGTMPCSERARR